MDLQNVFGTLKEELVLLNSDLPRFQKHVSRDELIEKIEAVILNVVESVASGKFPVLQVGTCSAIQNKHFAIRDPKQNPGNTYSINFKRIQSRSKFTIIVFLLSKIHTLLTTNQISTKRELYYENTAFFKSQNEVDRNLQDISYLLNTPPWELNVSATSKGIVAGPVVFTMGNGLIVTCDQPGGILIPQNVLEISAITSTAKWVLIIEKDAAFQKLLESNGLSRLGPVIFITAKGYPDINTRLLIRKIWDHLHIPILCLVDADPHGIEIMCTYRFGSMAMSPFSDHLACPFVRWLGVHPTDILSLNINFQKLTIQDLKKIDSLLNRPYILDHTELENQIKVLREKRIKAEIEGVSQISQAYIIDDYLPNKILGREFF